MMGTARYWREIPQRYRYEAARCTKCERIHFPPRKVCMGCRGRTFEKVVLPRDGTVETYTVIRVAPSGFVSEAPYAIGVVKLSNGVRVMGQIVDCKADELAIGDAVRLEFRRLREDGASGILCYGYKFVRLPTVAIPTTPVPQDAHIAKR